MIASTAQGLALLVRGACRAVRLSAPPAAVALAVAGRVRLSMMTSVSRYLLIKK